MVKKTREIGEQQPRGLQASNRDARGVYTPALQVSRGGQKPEAHRSGKPGPLRPVGPLRESEGEVDMEVRRRLLHHGLRDRVNVTK